MAIINGTSGPDDRSDTAASDTINGLGGDDRLTVRLGGTDVVNGDAGSDTLIVDYSALTQAVFDSNAPVANTALGGFDGRYFVNGSTSVSYSSIEHFEITTGMGNYNDTITTASGNDTVRTGAGNDIVDVGAGINTADGGTGIDRIAANFAALATGVSIDLNLPVNTGTFGSFANFEYFGSITGTAFDDRFVNAAGGNGTHVYNLGAGNDLADVRGATVTVHGGSGFDTLVVNYAQVELGLFNSGAPVANGALGGFDGRYFANGSNSVTYTSIERFDITTSRSAFDDTVTSATGDDRVIVFAGDDIVAMGTGNDTLVIDYSTAASALSTINGPTANAAQGGFNGKYSVSNAHEVAYTSVERFEITGTAFNDTIATASGDDLIMGGAGDDLLSGGAGNDTLFGGAGKDSMTGGSGDDVYIVEDANDVIVEAIGEGQDRIWALVDYVLADNVSIEIMGIGGAPTTVATLTGNDLANNLWGNAADNRLLGGGGEDALFGFEGADTLEGGEGADYLDGGTGADIMNGGSGDDTYLVDAAGDVVVETANGGFDRVYAQASWTLTANAAVEIVQAGDMLGTHAIDIGGNELANNLWGNNGANRLSGHGGNDTLLGFAGADTLEGGEGDDYLDGGTGADSLIGGAGNDIYVVDSAADVIVDIPGGGEDRVYAHAHYTLGQGVAVEVMAAGRLTDTAAINLKGNELANNLWGNHGGNVLDGGAGADVLLGQGGADTFAFSTALGPNNVDHILDFTTNEDKIQLARDVFATLTTGALAEGAFRLGGAAQDADDRIIYDGATGQLFYDADGTGGQAAVLFATLSTNLQLTHDHFTVA